MQAVGTAVALTGLSLRMASISSLSELFSHMRDGAELHTTAPHHRWDYEAVHHPAAPLLGADGGAFVATRFGTFVDSVHSFDASAFGLSQAEAAFMVRKHKHALHSSRVVPACCTRPWSSECF